MFFENKGPENTSRTLAEALGYAMEQKLPAVLATTSGASAVLFTQMAREQGFAEDIIIVTHANGHKEAGKQELLEENRQILLKNDAHIVTAAHVLSGAERGLSSAFGGIYPVEIIANTLRMFSQGMKVCVEIGSMALDAGQIPYGKPIVAIGGTGFGQDTAAVLVPAHAREILKTNIMEILCMPKGR